ncbi:MAG: hypothetical protein AAF902_18300, partial [Chloroflexota bacterium]
MKKIRVILAACLCVMILAACNTAEPVVVEEVEEAVSQTNAPEDGILEEVADEPAADAEGVTEMGEIKAMSARLLKPRAEDPFAAGSEGLSLSMNQAAESVQSGLATLIPTMDQMLAPAGPSNGVRVNRLGSGSQAAPTFSTTLGDRVTIPLAGISVQPPSSGFENYESEGEFTADATDDYYSIYVSGRELEANEDVDDFFDLVYDYVTNE